MCSAIQHRAALPRCPAADDDGGALVQATRTHLAHEVLDQPRWVEAQNWVWMKARAGVDLAFQVGHLVGVGQEQKGLAVAPGKSRPLRSCGRVFTAFAHAARVCNRPRRRGRIPAASGVGRPGSRRRRSASDVAHARTWHSHVALQRDAVAVAAAPPMAPRGGRRPPAPRPPPMDVWQLAPHAIGDVVGVHIRPATGRPAAAARPGRVNRVERSPP